MIQLTPEQQAVVKAPVGNILVSAAAGSGKTRVLTDRIVKRILDGETDVRSILVMTFTDMAALQMRDKIAEKLRAALTEATDEAQIAALSRQLMWLPGARISTIHAFCLSVIRDFYYEARGTDGEPLVLPDFRIAENGESAILLGESLDTLLQECHEAIDEAGTDPARLTFPAELAAALPSELAGSGFAQAFYRLTDGYGSPRNEEPLKELILTIYRYLRSMPDYTAFVRSKLDDYARASADFSGSGAAEVLLGQLQVRLERAMIALPELESMLGSVRFVADRKKNEEQTDRFRQAFHILRTLHEGLSQHSIRYDDVYEASRPLTVVSAPRGGRGDTPEKQAFTELFCTYVAEAVYTAAGGAGQKKCLEMFQFDPLIVCERPSEVIEAELQNMLPAIQCLFALILAIDSRYAEAKKQTGVIDFSDFEHLALTILRSPEAGAYYQARIQEIYIDEYQDTSSIQEAIIASVANRNCLMVGDVKQSIYQFRHARPQIFLDKHVLYTNGEDGSLYELNRNFRSQAGIIDTVNQWFSQLMSTAVGEIRYDERHALVSGAEPAAENGPAVRLLFLDMAAGRNGGSDSENPDPEMVHESDPAESDASALADDGPDQNGGEGEQVGDLSRDRKEALMVAAEIERLAASGSDFRDMAILARTRSILSHYAEVLIDRGIPIAEDTEQAFLETPILRLMEALVHVLDNRRQDIPLAAVMRSSFHAGGFSDDEMARIRLAARTNGQKPTYYHEAVDWYAREGDDLPLRDRVAGFLAMIDDLRDREPLLSIGELLDLAFERTGFRDRLARLPDGESQVADVDRFRTFADRFEQRSRRGIYAFARHIEQLHEVGQVQPALNESPPEQNAIRLLTMHRSKGLEFPIVFIVGTAYSLNPREKRQSLLISEQHGIGPDYVDPDCRVQYPTPLKQAMFEALKARSRSEELRLLYVAMTRAMKTLYLTGCFRIGPEGDPTAVRLIRAARSVTGAALPEHLVLSARSYLEWLLLALARNTAADLQPLHGDTAGDPIREPLAAGVPIPIAYHGLSDLERIASVQASRTPASGGADARPYQIRQDDTDTGADLDGTRLADSGTTFSSALLLTDPLPAGLAEPEMPLDEKKRILDQIETVILGDYPYPAAMKLPQKVSVSELKRRADRLAETEMPGHESRVIHGIRQTVDDWQPPADQALTAAETGTLTHQVFRFLDLPALVDDPSMSALETQLDRLQAHGVLRQETRLVIDPMKESFLQFFRSPIAARMRQAERLGRLYREMPFTIAIPARELGSDTTGMAPDDRMLVQGMIDIWFREDAQAVLIDFKTDRIAGDSEERARILRERYQVQIDLYAKAIRMATGLPVTGQFLYSVQDSRFIDLAR